MITAQDATGFVREMGENWGVRNPQQNNRILELFSLLPSLKLDWNRIIYIIKKLYHEAGHTLIPVTEKADFRTRQGRGVFTTEDESD